MLRRFIAPLIAVLVLSACILVDDFSPKWQKSTADSCVKKIAEGLYYSEFRRDPQGKDMANHARVFSIGKFHFLMLKQEPSDLGGRLYRFGIVNGIFQRYRLDPVMRTAFEIEFPDAPISFKHDTVRVASLSPEVMKLLTEISSRNEFWEIEDQTLYNIILNPLCTFDDRDLKKLKEDK